MKSISQYIEEKGFQGWPDWDDQDNWSINRAIDFIKSNREYQKYGWSHFIEDNIPQSLRDYLNDDMNMDDRAILISKLGLSGMLLVEQDSFSFIQPIKHNLSMYPDEFGDDDVSITMCYDINRVPSELKEYGREDNGKFIVYSYDCPNDIFDKRAHGKIPKIGLLWVMSETSGVFPGYWCKDNTSKEHMKKYCGMMEFKNGNVVK